MELIDSHCHLDFPEFDDDRAELIEACKLKNVTKFVVPGVSRVTWPRLQQVTSTHPECYPAYGLHPYFINEHQVSDITELEQILKAHHPIAIGEIGLDYYLKDLDKEKQQDFFYAQLVLAHEFNLPVILHVRKAHDDVLKALRKYKIKGGIVHAFNGSFQQAEQYSDLGFKLGFGGALISEKALHLRKLAQELPLKSIVLETDSPDMLPINSKSSRNTPLTILTVLDVLSSFRSESSDQISKQTTLNVLGVFNFN